MGWRAVRVFAQIIFAVFFHKASSIFHYSI